MQHNFRQISQAVADFHYRQCTVKVGHCHPKHRRSLELHRGLHARLAVVFIATSQALGELGLQVGLGDWAGHKTWIQQFVEQHREARNFAGNVGAALTKTDQAIRCELILV